MCDIQPLALDVSHFPEPDSDHPLCVESQAQFEAIDPLKMLALASAFIKLHRPKLREMIRVHRTALARWLTRHFTAFLPELMRYDVTEQDVFALIPDLLSDVLSKEGEDALVMVNQLVENQKHFTSREYLRFLVKDCFQGYILHNRAFLAEFYSRHRRGSSWVTAFYRGK